MTAAEYGPHLADAWEIRWRLLDEADETTDALEFAAEVAAP
jgi:hypothetical protein